MGFSDLVVLVISIGAIVIGSVCKDFSWATGIGYASAPSRRAPTWMGRVAFIGFGVLLLVPELIHLFSK